MKKVAIQKAGADIKLSVKELVTELGGFEKFVELGDTVLIKPNYNTSDSPPASTSLDFLQAVVEICFETGAASVIVGESSTIVSYQFKRKAPPSDIRWIAS